MIAADKYTVEVQVTSYSIYSKTFLRHHYRQVSQENATDSFKFKLFEFRGDSSIQKIGESKSNYYNQNNTESYYFEIGSLDSIWQFYEKIEHWGGVSKLKIRAEIGNERLLSIENLLKKRYLRFQDSTLNNLLQVNNLSHEDVFMRIAHVHKFARYDYNPEAYMKKVDIDVVLPPTKYSIIISYLIYPRSDTN